MTKRTDIHRPSAINPGEYTLTGNVYDLKYNDLESLDVGTKPYGHCNHCGKAIRWAVEFTHKSGDVVVFGEICAEILSLSDDRTKHDLVLLKRRVANLEKELRLKQERDENYATFSIQQPEVVEYLENLYDQDRSYFLKSLKWNLERYGMLTTAQVEAFNRVIKQREEEAAKKLAEPIPTHPVAEGRLTLEGEVLSTKYQHTDFGTIRKMLVRLADANKVWGTVPANIDSQVDRGVKVKFVASVKRSDSDDNFGYFSRPAKAEVVNNG